MSDGRFAGREGVIVLLNSTTGDGILPDVNVESWTIEPLVELTEHAFTGEIGPHFRPFSKGYSLKVKVQYNNVAQFVAFYNLMKARLEGANSDEFAAGLKCRSDLGEAMRFTCRDLQPESLPAELGGQTEFLSGDLSFKGRDYKVEAA